MGHVRAEENDTHLSKLGYFPAFPCLFPRAFNKVEDLLKRVQKTGNSGSLITKHKNSCFDLLGVDILYLFIFLMMHLFLCDNVKASVSVFVLVVNG